MYQSICSMVHSHLQPFNSYMYMYISCVDNPAKDWLHVIGDDPDQRRELHEALVPFSDLKKLAVYCMGLTLPEYDAISRDNQQQTNDARVDLVHKWYEGGVRRYWEEVVDIMRCMGSERQAKKMADKHNIPYK